MQEITNEKVAMAYIYMADIGFEKGNHVGDEELGCHWYCIRMTLMGVVATC